MDTPDLYASFGKHMNQADGGLEQHAELYAQLRRNPRYRDVYLLNWSELWRHLDKARAIVAQLGRDGGRFDEARASAGDPRLVAEGRVAINEARCDATREAISALRECVTEVPGRRAKRNRSPEAKAARFWATAGLGALLKLLKLCIR